VWPKPVLDANMLAAKAKNGDIRAFERLYGLYKSSVYALCLHLTRDARDAEDLTQEVFLQVYLKIDSFRGEAAFGSWLYRVTTNCVMMHLRKAHHEEVPLEVLEADSRLLRSVSHLGNHRQCDPVQRITLLRALSGLSKRRRALILLRDFKGLTHSEVAQCLGVSVGTSKSRVFSAHRKLRDLLGSVQTAQSSQGNHSLIAPRTGLPGTGVAL
jgi:RNA polymerase sigma-70 factor (ECF subfamily)